MLPEIQTNLKLFEKSPCIRPVWDPGSQSGLVLTCLGLEDEENDGDGARDDVRWAKVSTQGRKEEAMERAREEKGERKKRLAVTTFHHRPQQRPRHISKSLWRHQTRVTQLPSSLKLHRQNTLIENN